MHLYASPHEVHSVDTLHSDALAFLRIQAHSDAFTHTRIQGECRPPKGLAQLQDSCMLTRVCILTHSYAYVSIHMYSYAFVYIRMHSYAFSCLQLVEEHPAQRRVLGGVLGRAAPLGRQLVDRLRRDGAVLVAASACFFFSRKGIILIWSTVLPAETMTVSR